MGVKELWSVLSPYSERKPLSELRGKTVAIDLAGWICESLNVVDYYIHPRQHLKNLFFRTSCLIWEDVTPVFVLEGTAPGLKKGVIAKRNEIQFRGVRPKTQKKSSDLADTGIDQSNKSYGRQRFNHVLKQCESLLKTMGINCIQAPGEAEAFCAFLNKKNIVDGVISQDSDCFAYGAIRVYRNFCISTRGTQSAQGGAIDVYDMEKIQRTLDFGQNKAIVMALLCGCDYCPTGIDGIGRDGVLKMFQKYRDNEIVDKLRCWRRDADNYKTLELRIDDKNACKNCGHSGCIQGHLKSGCSVCCTSRGCDDTYWKEERLLIKAELALRKKALANPHFPSEEIIQEFLSEPTTVPEINLTWNQPNVVKFIKKIGPLLQWTDTYSFQKFFPVFARWQICNDARSQRIFKDTYITPMKIAKMRTIKGISSIEILWMDQKGLFNGIVPEEEIHILCQNSKKNDLSKLLTTVEPLFLVKAAYPTLLESYYNQNGIQKKKGKTELPLGVFENLSDLLAETNNIAAEAKVKKSQQTRKGIASKNLQTIDKYFNPKDGKNFTNTGKDYIQPSKNFQASNSFLMQCSTPIMKSLPFELETDSENESIDVSGVISEIVEKPLQREISRYTGCILQYEPAGNISEDDFDLKIEN